MNNPVKASQLNSSAIRPIRVSPESSKMTASFKRKRQHYVSPLFDDCDHKRKKEDLEYMLSPVKAGPLLRKRSHDSPNLQEIDTDFG